MKVFKLTVMAALLTAGAIQGRADVTNLVENINIRLYGFKQGGTRTNGNQVVTSVDTITVETRNVIRALGAATGNTFSPASRLVLVTPQGGGFSSVEVRDGGSKVDVTAFFALEQSGASVSSSVLNTKTGRSTQTTFSIQHFELHEVQEYSPLSLHFDVSGFGVDFSANRPFPGPDNNLSIDVTGTGDRNGDPIVIQGSIRISGQTLEVVPGGGEIIS